GERGPHHEPEFTMLEWYRAEPSLEAVALDCERLLEAVGVTLRLERTTVRALWRQHVGAELQIPDPAPAGWDDDFFQTWLDRVEPHLGNTFVFDWPLPLGALARRKADDPKLVERFELYAGGLELVNAFG